ncbi:MAG: C45 family autoproteolytic acyltransferase/hydrolase [Candidatus Sigynarchaeota archaeon]
MDAQRFVGTHLDMGRQQGKAYAEAMHGGLESFKGLEVLRSMKPRLIPAGYFLWIAGGMAKRFLEPIYARYAPRLRDRIKGIAIGAGINERHVWFFSSSEIVLGINDYEVPLACGCTTVVLKPSMMSSARATVARNFDFASFIVPYLRVRRNEPTGLLRSMDITAAPLPGTFNGFNEAGVFISTNEAFPVAKGIREPGLPASAIIQEALETANTTQEAIDTFKRLPRGSCNIITIADKHGDAVSLEYTSKEIHEVVPGDGEGFLVATNHYITPGLAAIDLPLDAVFGKKAPRSLRGTCINKTSVTRRKTATAWLAAKAGEPGSITAEALQSLLRDHSANGGTGGMETICHHDPENISAASMIVDLAAREMWACFGLPCEHEYERFFFDE